MAEQPHVINWLLDSDPSIRWQVMRDLTNEADAIVAGERSRVASEGWGARLLDLQGADGHWGGAAFVPRAWISTKDTLQLLRDLGVDPTSDRVRRAIGQVRDRCTWGPEFGNSPFFEGEIEPCINGRVLAIGAYFGEASDRLVERLLEEQLERRRLELRCPEQSLVVSAGLHAVVIPFDDLCARRIAGIRKGEGTETRGHRCSPSRTGVPPRAASVPIAVNRTGHQSCVDTDFVPDALALRHPVGAGLPAESRRRTREPHRRGRRAHRQKARSAWPLAARESARGNGPLRDGRQRRRAEPVEYAPSLAGAALVRQHSLI